MVTAEPATTAELEQKAEPAQTVEQRAGIVQRAVQKAEPAQTVEQRAEIVQRAVRKAEPALIAALVVKAEREMRAGAGKWSHRGYHHQASIPREWRI